ncbi:Mor transcription activator family protein [Shewanella algae]|uniref:Mor transcription activator family protein n=1 Tax=Shewanella algae TaxID=38313 RepID=UPI0009F57BC5|nr:Mor transcription activator family protein [Shewanella algae]
MAVVAEVLATILSSYLGGQDLYIPKGERLNVALRNIRIWRELKGNNLERLSHQYDLSEWRQNKEGCFKKSKNAA